MGKMDLFTVKATAKAIRRRAVILKVAAVVAGISISILLIFYGLIHFANSLGNFTVKVADESDEFKITLSEDKSFENPTTFLHAEVLDDMDNITESWLPDDVDEIDGPHNGNNYIAYTFYIKNIGNKPLDYNVDIAIDSVSKETDEAIRVKVYKNGESIVYAKYQKDSIIPEPNTTPFYSSRLVMSELRESFKAGDIDKYTIVIWLEGNDPECLDSIKGGNVKMTMNFEIVGTE